MEGEDHFRSLTSHGHAIRKLTDCLWAAKTGGMLVPARIYATEEMIAQIVRDKAPQQAANVAHLPGIVTASLAVPDIHWGSGFPIAASAAFDPDAGRLARRAYAIGSVAMFWVLERIRAGFLTLI